MSLIRRGNNIKIYCSFIVRIWTDNTIANLEQMVSQIDSVVLRKPVVSIISMVFNNGDFFRNRSVVPKVKKMVVFKLTSPT